MTDIIQDAKKLLEGATPGPWELYGGEIHHIQHTPEQCTSFRCDYRWPVLSENWGENPGVAAADEDLTLMAAAPELAQALAEETWEYSYHIKRQGEWEPTRNMETRREDWWDDRLEVVETVELLRASGFEARIVRRRVSPPEVINE